MRRSLALLPLGVALLAPAAPARAVELLPGAELLFEFSASALWDNNFNNQDRWDAALEISPSVRLRDTEGRFTYNFGYRPNWEGILRINGANSWDHPITGSLAYDLTNRTQLFASGNFVRSESISSRRQQIFSVAEGEEADITAETSPNAEFTTERRRRWSYTAGLRHIVSPRSTLTLQGTQSESRRASTTQFDAAGNPLNTVSPQSLVRSIVGQWSYVLTQADNLAAVVSWSKSSFGSDTNRISSQLQWVHRFDSTLQFTLQIGPQWARPDETDKVLHAQVLQYPFILDGSNDPILRDTDDCRDVGGFPVLSPTCGTIFVGPASDRFNPSPTGSVQLADGSITGSLIADAEEEILPQQVALVPVLTKLRPGSSKTSSDLIWSFAIQKSWRLWDLRADMSRSEGGSETLGSSVKTTRANVALNWQPAHLWDVALRGAWQRQETKSSALTPFVALRRSQIDTELLGLEDIGTNVLTDITTRNPIQVAEAFGLVYEKTNQKNRFDTYQASLRIQRKISEALTTTLSVGYRLRRQKSKSTVGSSRSRFDSTRVTLGFTYRFDPIGL